MLSVPYWTSSRLGLSFIAFLGFINLYALRINMSVVIVCMVNNTAIKGFETPLNNSSTNRSNIRIELDENCGASNATENPEVKTWPQWRHTLWTGVPESKGPQGQGAPEIRGPEASRV